jgi:hypothetical protein
MRWYLPLLRRCERGWCRKAFTQMGRHPYTDAGMGACQMDHVLSRVGHHSDLSACLCNALDGLCEVKFDHSCEPPLHLSLVFADSSVRHASVTAAGQAGRSWEGL